MLKKEIRIVHCSDVHIGYQFKSLDLKSEKRTAELKDSFFRFLSACSQETPDLVLISGDLFDDTSVFQVNDVAGCLGMQSGCQAQQQRQGHRYPGTGPPPEGQRQRRQQKAQGQRKGQADGQIFHRQPGGQMQHQFQPAQQRWKQQQPPHGHAVPCRGAGRRAGVCRGAGFRHCGGHGLNPVSAARRPFVVLPAALRGG